MGEIKLTIREVLEYNETVNIPDDSEINMDCILRVATDMRTRYLAEEIILSADNHVSTSLIAEDMKTGTTFTEVIVEH